MHSPPKIYPEILLRFLAIFACIIFVVGCSVPHMPWRVLPGIAPPILLNTSIEALQNSEEQQRLAQASIESHESFSLAFVEFDDQGEFWNRNQADYALFETSYYAAEQQGVIVVVYVHGWQHNASVCDQNVACFRALLNRLAALESRMASIQNKKPRRVVGIYLGWRGLSTTTPGLKELTFWSRKATAERIGRGGALEFLSILDRTAQSWRANGHYGNRLIIIGHSFGADIVFSALEGVLKSRAAAIAADPRSVIPGFFDSRSVKDTTPLGDASELNTGADIVFLINPAFEASRYETFDRVTRNMDFETDQMPVLITLSSKTDAATNVAFPWGRRIETLFQASQSSEQERAMVTTLGNYDPFITHDIFPCSEESSSLKKQSSVDTDRVCNCALKALADKEVMDAIIRQLTGPSPGNLTDLKCIGTTQLQPRQADEGDRRKKDNPFWVLSAAKEISDGHSDIFTNHIISFVTHVATVVADRSAVEARSKRFDSLFWNNRRTYLEQAHLLLDLPIKNDLDKLLRDVEWAFTSKRWKSAVTRLDQYNKLALLAVVVRHCGNAGEDKDDNTNGFVFEPEMAKLESCGVMTSQTHAMMTHALKNIKDTGSEDLQDVAETYRRAAYFNFIWVSRAILRRDKNR